MTAEYLYTTLDNHSSVCRVLELLPGAFYDDIYLRLYTSELSHSKRQPFEALSYTWGTEEDRQKIFVVPGDADGIGSSTSSGFILATQNLVEALRYLRLRKHVPWRLWIDAVCINQADTAERNAQVQLMPSIYRSAAHVLVWLGPEADDSTWAINRFRLWASKVNYDSINNRLALKIPSEEDAWMVDLYVALQHDGRTFLACRAFTRRSWFERLWIQQEIYLGASKATIICGCDSISWAELRTGLHLFVGRSPQTGTPDHLDFLVRRKIISVLGSEQTNPVSGLLLRAREAKCREPRDKVYGILGMLRDQDAWFAEAIKPDYDQKLDDLYKLVLKTDIARYRRLDMVEYCEPRPESTWRPTWVPNWAASGTAGVMGIERQYADLKANASLSTISGDVLQVKGVVAATITDMTNILLQVKDDPKVILLEVKRLCHHMSVHISPATGVDLLIAMLYTVSIGKLWDQEEKLSLFDSVVFLQALIDGEFDLDDPNGIDYSANPAIGPLINVCSQVLPSRSMARTDKGHLVLGPSHMREGDVVAIALGLSTVMVLRAQQSEHYQLVGLCFSYGLNWGEALVGPLPKPWHVLRKIRLSGRWVPAFQNSETGDVTEWDPRIIWEELIIPEVDGWQDVFFWKQNGKIWKYPDEAYFLRRGTKLGVLNLI